MTIAVLIPVYNDPAGLMKTLGSLSNALGEFFVLVVDDGSSDRVSGVDDFGFEVQILALKTNHGIEHALNRGLDYLTKSNYSFIARLDSGDEVYPERFVEQAKFLLDNEEVYVVGSYIDVVDESGKFLYCQRYPLKHKDICIGLRYQNQLCHPGIMFRSSVFESNVRYPMNRPAAEDYALLFQLSKQVKLANIPLSLTRYVVSDNSISSTKRSTQCYSRLKVQVENFTFFNHHCYFGVVRTLILLYIPRRVSLFLKRTRSE